MEKYLGSIGCRVHSRLDRSVSAQMTRSKPEGCPVVEEMFVSRLEADIPEFKHLKGKSPERMFHSVYACVFYAVTPCSKARHIFTVQFATRRKKSLGQGASLSISYLKVRSLSVLFLFSILPPERGFFLLCYSQQTSLSKRQEVKGEAPMACGVVVTSEPTAVTSGSPTVHSLRLHSIERFPVMQRKTQQMHQLMLFVFLCRKKYVQEK